MKEEVDYSSMSWNKEFTLVGSEPFSFTESGAVLCFHTNLVSTKLSCYDFRSSSDDLLGYFCLEISPPPIPHMNTLVSLRGLGEKNTEIMESI